MRFSARNLAVVSFTWLLTKGRISSNYTEKIQCDSTHSLQQIRKRQDKTHSSHKNDVLSVARAVTRRRAHWGHAGSSALRYQIGRFHLSQAKPHNVTINLKSRPKVAQFPYLILYTDSSSEQTTWRLAVWEFGRNGSDAVAVRELRVTSITRATLC